MNRAGVQRDKDLIIVPLCKGIVPFCETWRPSQLTNRQTCTGMDEMIRRIVARLNPTGDALGNCLASTKSPFGISFLIAAHVIARSPDHRPSSTESDGNSLIKARNGLRLCNCCICEMSGQRIVVHVRTVNKVTSGDSPVRGAELLAP
jgi:hypothetical protein